MEIKPILFNIFMAPFEKLALNKRRSEIISKVHGKVLEIGAGTGVNFNYYKKDKIRELTVLDVSSNSLIKEHPLNKEVKVNYIEGDAHVLPFEDNTFDSVVSTLIYCSVEDPDKVLSEVYRVLKGDGKLYFIEHVLPHREGYRKAAHKLNNLWKSVGKCNINRETLETIKAARFKVTDYERFGRRAFVFIKGIGVKQE